MARQAKRFTVYDMMEEKGVFDANPANVYARDNNGLSIYKLEEFPKMLYHPKGEEKVVREGVAIATPFGPKMVGEQRELISQVVRDAEGEAKLLKAGWHRTPAMAERARLLAEGKEAPKVPENPLEAERLSHESEMAAMREKLAELERKNAALALTNEEIGNKVAIASVNKK